MASTLAFAPIKASRLSTVIFSPSTNFSGGGHKRLVVKAVQEANVPEAGAPVAGPNRGSKIVSGWLDHIEIRNQYRDLWNQTKKHPTTKETNTTSIFSQKSTGDETGLQKSSRFVIMAALTVGVVAVLLVDKKAIALGPEGPLMEEFWENMRRYALYALTVSTGVAYAVFQPLYELLRNPISAILVIAIGFGSFYLVSQVLSAMVGVSDFTYQYSY